MSLKDWTVSDEKENLQYYMSLWTKWQTHAVQETDSDEVSIEWQDTPASDLGTYILIVQAIVVTTFIAAVVSLVIALIAYCKREWRILYKIAAIILIVAAICMLIAVILFPVKFTNNFPFNAHFDFEWAYGLGWAAMCFILTAAILFLISVDTKEIYHAEKRLSL
jgi:amino acid transporter